MNIDSLNWQEDETWSDSENMKRINESITNIKGSVREVCPPEGTSKTRSHILTLYRYIGNIIEFLSRIRLTCS